MITNNLIEDAKRGGLVSEIMRRLGLLEASNRKLSARGREWRTVLTAGRTYYVRYNVGTCTITNASPAVVTAAAHGLEDDDPVVFHTTGSLPTGLTAGTVYYVVNKTTNTFEVSATVGGSSINTSSAGSGTHSVATGSDSNDGLSTGRAGALLTIQQAVDLAASLDTSIYNITITVAKSHYKEKVTCKNVVGAGQVSIVGDISTYTNCVLDGAWNKLGLGTIYDISGFAMKNTWTAYFGFELAFGAVVYFANVDFGTGFLYQCIVTNYAQLLARGAYSISGGAIYHMYVGQARFTNALSWTITLTGTPNFTGAFAYADILGSISYNSTQITFAGAATGKRYSATLNSVINTTGGGAAYLPGNIAGTTATGGQYA